MLGVTVELDWTAVGVLLTLVAALASGLIFVVGLANRQKYMGKKQRKIIKAIFRQNKMSQRHDRMLMEVRNSLKSIMVDRGMPTDTLAESGTYDAMPENLNVDGLFTEDELSDDEDD